MGTVGWEMKLGNSNGDLQTRQVLPQLLAKELSTGIEVLKPHASNVIRDINLADTTKAESRKENNVRVEVSK